MNRMISLDISLFRDGPTSKWRIRTLAFLQWYKGYYRDARFSFDLIYPTTLSSRAKDGCWALGTEVSPSDRNNRVIFSNLEASSKIVIWSRCNHVDASTRGQLTVGVVFQLESWSGCRTTDSTPRREQS